MMLPKKSLIVVVAVVLIVAMLFFTGLLPGLSMIGSTVTDNKNVGGIIGRGELIGPNDRKGFIMSHIDDGFSQTITCIGKDRIDSWASAATTKYRYKVYGKETTFGKYELLSQPGETSMYLSNKNPGVVNFEGWHVGGTFNADAYSFEFIGTKYKAMKVEYQIYADWNILNPFDEGYHWQTLQVDEAELFEGWGGLSYPVIDGKPRSTFEIGETAKILVKTHYGGDVGENGKAWKVVMRYPADRGGEPYKTELYADNVETHFTFTVTESMFSKVSDNSYTISIENTLVEKGKLLVKSIDIRAKAPSEVSLSGPNQIKIGETVTIELSAEVNSDTQLPIDHFQVSVYYGAKDTLMPSDPFSKRWILPTYDIKDLTESGNTFSYSLTFSADEVGYEDYVTVSAWAYDTEGRSSINEKKWVLWIYETSPVPDETIEDQTGESYGFGGHTEGWRPWDPGGGNWEVAPGIIINWIGVLVAAIIIGMFVVAGLKMPGRKENKIIVGVIGIIVAVIVYVYYFTSMFTGG